MAQDTSPTDAAAPPVGPAGNLPSPVDAVKPRLRGWIHAINFPLVVVAGTLLTVAAPPTAPRVACLVFAITAALLFGTSAVYHLGNWRPSVKAALRRADHTAFGALMNDIEAALACPSSEEPTHAYNVVSGMCDACADRCGGTLCQSMALHNICNRIHSLLAGDGE